jgi:hypothetical protein
MEATVPRDAIVVRFRPTEVDSLLRWAEKSHRLTGRYTLSVFADRQVREETADQTIARLLQSADLSGIDPNHNPRYYVCSQAGDLLDRGFTFLKDDEEDELPEHYSVDLGPSPDRATVCRFLEVFGPAIKRVGQ